MVLPVASRETGCALAIVNIFGSRYVDTFIWIQVHEIRREIAWLL